MRFCGMMAPAAGAGPFTGQPAVRLPTRMAETSASESFLGRPGGTLAVTRSAVSRRCSVSAPVESLRLSVRPFESWAGLTSLATLSGRLVSARARASWPHDAKNSRLIERLRWRYSTHELDSEGGDV